MRKIVKLGGAAVMAAVLSTFASAGAEAQQVRTFVSGHGTDSGICGVTSPCRHFSYAMTQVGPGGEIVVLDSAGYGAVTINQAVTIAAPAGVEGSITATSGDAIAISAGATDTVVLRGLTLVGGGGLNGITINTAGTVVIDHCLASGFTINGIKAVQTNGILQISDTVVMKNGSAGIQIAPGPTGGIVRAYLQRVQAIGNGSPGIVADGSSGSSALVSVADSVASFNTYGFMSTSLDGEGSAVLDVVRSQAIGNSTGLFTSNINASMYLSQSSVMNSISLGFQIASSSKIFTFQNNYITDGGSGTLTNIAVQ